MASLSLGLKDALRLTLETVRPLPQETIPLLESLGRVAAQDLLATVDSPSQSTSRKDGYAVLSHEVAHATAQSPVRLKLAGSMAAGDQEVLTVKPGTTVRVLTGARIPSGADAVVSEEFTRRDEGEVVIETFADTAKNILRAGGDVARGKLILEAGQSISPVMAGLLAAAGHDRIPVYALPRVGILGTGNEIVLPGNPLKQGELYASNIVTLAGFCRQYGMQTSLSIVGDTHDAMLEAMRKMHQETEVMITSGGAWRGDHDIVAQVLGELGWKKVFHRIRIGPGKAVGFGLLEQKPVFILPGGPPSNLMGFLQIALPGILALSGHANPGLPRVNAQLAQDIVDGDKEWTDFFQGTLSLADDLPLFHPLPKRSRLKALARATAVAAIPEGRDSLEQGEVVSVQLLSGGLGA
ncbi:MAG: molybdopterin molybdotransferase MoeA [Deltaproteobacteria bacterium]|nr:molybdopterin molybdotransferase MoeA [Deltaproteobacteria bacterium]